MKVCRLLHTSSGQNFFFFVKMSVSNSHHKSSKSKEFQVPTWKVLIFWLITFSIWTNQSCWKYGKNLIGQFSNLRTNQIPWIFFVDFTSQFSQYWVLQFSSQQKSQLRLEKNILISRNRWKLNNLTNFLCVFYKKKLEKKTDALGL